MHVLVGVFPGKADLEALQCSLPRPSSVTCCLTRKRPKMPFLACAAWSVGAHARVGLGLRQGYPVCERAPALCMIGWTFDAAMTPTNTAANRNAGTRAQNGTLACISGIPPWWQAMPQSATGKGHAGISPWCRAPPMADR